MRKQILLVVLMLLPALVWADEFDYNGVTYYVMDSQTPTVQVQRINVTGDVVIPTSVYNNGKYYTVKRFGMCGNSGITSITIPNTVDRFVEDAFSGCTGLTAVKITDLTAWCKIHMTLGGIGSYTDSYSSNPLRFAHNLYNNYGTLYTSVTVPSTITELGDGIFEGASCLTSVTLQSTLKSIGWCCFQDCTGLTEITIPNNVETIGRRAFRGCSNLKTVTIGSGVKSINYLAFDGCTKLSQIVCEAATPPTLETSVFSDNTLSFTTLVVPKGKKSAYQNAEGWGNFQNIIELGGSGYEFEYSGFKYRILENNPSTYTYTCELIKANASANVVIPSSGYCNELGMSFTVTTIGYTAFSGMKDIMTQVTIPATVKRVREDAFKGCTALTRVNINDLKAFCEMVVEDSQTAFDNHPTYYSHHLYLYNSEITALNIPNGVKTIKDGTFAGCSSFTSVTFPTTVEGIGYAAFYGCSGLTEITFPNSVQDISHGAFSDCTSLTKVNFGTGLTDIYDYAFYGCDNLSTIEMAASTPPTVHKEVASESSAFGENTLKRAFVVVPKGAVTAYRNNTEWNRFTNIVELWGVGYPYEFYGINYVIQENNTLAVVPKAGGYSGNINFPITLYINNIPYTITTFGMNAFAGCTNMTSISIPATLTRIKEGAFAGCTGLTAVYISDLVAFCNIEVEDNMTAEDNHPTYYAHHLYLNGTEIRDLTIPDDNRLTGIKTATFAGLTSLTSVTIPGRVTGIGIHAFAGCSSLKSAIIPSSVTFIASGAFQNCSSLTTLVSLKSSAPECSYEPFYGIDKGKCVLWVPRGCKANYTGANYWNSFLYTNELIMGDANVDGVVNAADIVEAINAKKNTPSTRFVQYNVDQTGNGVDASDINAIVNKTMGK